jgi:hypothetical protein
MRSRPIGGVVFAGMLALVIGCGGGEQEQAEVAEASMMPDTTAAALWAHLSSTNYQSWNMWPDKGRLYMGQQPHGMLLTTYVNNPARNAIMNKAGVMPAGAIVVKENYMPDSTLAAVTVMYKRPGFNPEHNDWYFLKRLADGTVEVQGRGAGCQNCHQGVRANDYLFTSPIVQ